MVREAVKVELLGSNNDGDPVYYTVADGTAISKGTLLAMSDPRTAAANAATYGAIAGIAAMQKVASDGATTIAVWTNGIFEMYASNAITIGSGVCGCAQPNYVIIASAATVSSGAAILGYAMEAATDGEVVNIRVRL